MSASRSEALLFVEDLHVQSEGVEILNGIDLAIGAGEVHALMGPNGSGKSTLANVIMGHPAYEVKEGRILFKGKDLLPLSPDERGRLGIFLAFQYPESVPGVPIYQFLRQAMSARRGEDVSAVEARVEILEWLDRLGFDPSFASRALNEGFSGGERKRSELLQMAVLQPELAILDEIDTGMDVDGLKAVARAIGELKKVKPSTSFLIISHYATALMEVKPDFVHVLIDGRIAESGSAELAVKIEKSGYEAWR